MKKLFKWIGIILAGMLGLLIVQLWPFILLVEQS
jgi:hypothetical protein